ncbi:hypothetical protein AB7309_19145 [Providencia manganoxydans]|uniref:hypothetical protein n=1 Tax=Providencia manganoxydans TaxID=2923283 RepID=UPI0034E448A2
MDDKIKKTPRELFFDRIKLVSPKIFKNFIEADGNAPAVCYRCGSEFLLAPIEVIAEACEDHDEISYLRPCRSNYILETEAEEQEYEYGLSNYHYKVSCSRCAAEMTFDIDLIVKFAEKLNKRLP